MKPITRLALAAALALSIPLTATSQVAPYAVKGATLLSAYDLDGEAADPDQIVVAATLADAGTYTIAAQPDTCRLIDLTIVDANSSITAGVVTVVGLDCYGDDLTSTFTFTAGGSGVKTLVVSSPSKASGAYYSSITSITSGTLTGEGGAGDTIAVGYSNNSDYQWVVYGARTPLGPLGERGITVWNSIPIQKNITTSGSLTTSVTSVGSNGAFAQVAAGDLLIINIKGVEYERRVDTRSDANNITVNKALNIPTTGSTFSFKKRFVIADPVDLAVIEVEGWNTLLIRWSIDANVNTGGLLTKLECARRGPEFPVGGWETVGDGTFRIDGVVTTASGAAQLPISESFDLSKLPYTYCRFGMKFGTGDDGDGIAEDINVQVALLK